MSIWKPERLDREVKKHLKGNDEPVVDLETAYNKHVNQLVAYARGKIVRKDEALDAVHEAFEKLLEYKQKNPDSKISLFLLYKKVLHACIMRNKKFMPEVISDERKVDESVEPNEDGSEEPDSSLN